MEPWQIILLVFGIIIGIYAVIVIVDIIFVITFKRIFTKHNVALKILMMRKYDAIKSLIDLLVDNNVPVEFKYIKMFQDINPACFENLCSPECRNANESFTILKTELRSFVHSSEKLMKHNAVIEIIGSLREMDLNYRTLVSMYNADVLGYNYWIHFLPTRYIYNWLKVTPKEMI